MDFRETALYCVAVFNFYLAPFFGIPEPKKFHYFVKVTWHNATLLSPIKEEDLSSVKKSIARLVLLSSLVLSAYSVVGAVSSQGRLDGPNPMCVPPECQASVGK